MKNLKLFFFFLFLPFLVVPSLFFLPSPPQSAFTTSSPKVARAYPGVDDWTLEKRRDILWAFSFSLNEKVNLSKDWLLPFLLGLKKITFKREKSGAVTTFYFDKLGTALEEQIWKQQKSLRKIDFSQIQGEAQKQLLQLFSKNFENGGRLIYENDLFEQIFEQKSHYQYLLFDSIKFLLLKMQILDLSKYEILGTLFDISFLFNLQGWEDWEKPSLWSQSGEGATVSRWLSAHILSAGDINKAKSVLSTTINHAASSWLKVLQKASGFGLNHITVNNAQVDVSSLVNSSKKEASDLSLEELQTLKELQSLTLLKFQTQVQTWIDFQLDSYKFRIQKSLENFATSKITQIKINGTTYQVNLLLKNTNLQLSGSQLPDDAKNQLLALVRVKITSQELTKAFQNVEAENILAFQKNWDGGEISTYLLWLPVFDIKEVKLSQNEVLPVDALATAIETMLTKEKFDFTKLEKETRKQLLDLLNTQDKIREEKTFQDDVWRQIKNHQKWKAIEGPAGKLSLQLIKTLLLKIQDLGITKVSHPFFPEGYDLSFLKDSASWKQISFKNLLQGMIVKVNDTYVEFYSHLFPNQVVFQVPMKKLDTVFSEITITNIIRALERVISDHLQQEKKLETKNQGLIIGLSVVGGVLVLGGFLYWFFKIKK